jgi:hypothetical protein
MTDGPPAPATPRSRPRALRGLKEIEAALGRTITIVGEAAEAKLGAVVVIDGSAIYCLGQERWPDGVVGEQVEVTGTVSRTDRFRAEVLEEDAITQGTAGGDLVIEPCRFHLLTVD